MVGFVNLMCVLGTILNDIARTDARSMVHGLPRARREVRFPVRARKTVAKVYLDFGVENLNKNVDHLLEVGTTNASSLK